MIHAHRQRGWELGGSEIMPWPCLRGMAAACGVGWGWPQARPAQPCRATIRKHHRGTPIESKSRGNRTCRIRLRPMLPHCALGRAHVLRMRTGLRSKGGPRRGVAVVAEAPRRSGNSARCDGHVRTGIGGDSSHPCCNSSPRSSPGAQ